jgi:oligosaccharide reducing-end xylanase
MNIAVDYSWFAKNEWAITESNKILDFFYNEGLENYVDQYTLDGIKLSGNNSPGLVAMNAVASLASTNNNRIDFVKALWELPIPDGSLRYYNGMLYMMALLHVSGNFKIYDLDEKPVSFCPE